MAVVVYRCDTCKREVELIRNIRGLETVQRCVITQGCRGKLYQSDLKEDYSRAAIPETVEGLDDWQQRRVLYNHTQTIESSRWTIQHNLGTFPSVIVFVDRPTIEDENNREEIIPDDVVIVDSDTLQLRFTRPQSGIAQLVARASDPQLLSPTVSVAVQVVEPTQISNDGRIVLATRLDLFPINQNAAASLRLTFRANTGSESTSIYAIQNQASDAWQNAGTALIKGKLYAIRQFNGLSTEILNNQVASGTGIRFTSFDFDGNIQFEYVINDEDVEAGTTKLGREQILILFAKAPFDIVDKVTNKYIDVTSITSASSSDALYYSSGEFFASPSVIQTVYPPIRTL